MMIFDFRSFLPHTWVVLFRPTIKLTIAPLNCPSTDLRLSPSPASLDIPDKFQLVVQQIALINTEGIALTFDDDALREIAKCAAHLNRTVENIGARRLHTVLERIMEEISFQAAEMERGGEVRVTKKLVKDRLSDILTSSDLSKYIL
jgi:hypothetical protein